jgi:hypothetical protein
VNPPRKGRTVAKRRKTKKRRKLSAKQIAAGFGGKRRKAASTKRRRKTSTVTRKRKGARTVAKRRTHKRRATTKRRTHRRRRAGTIKLTKVRGAIYRKNPRFSIRGIGNQLIEGTKGAAAVVVGKVAGRQIANLIPLPKDTMVSSIGTQVVAALVLGMVGKRFLPGKLGEFLFVGALTAPVETALKSVPGIGPMLGEDPFLPIGEDPFLPIGAYPDGMAAYPEAAVEGYDSLMY